MNKSTLGSLIALNAALLIATVVVSLPSPTQAAGRGRGSDFTLISSESQASGGSELVWVIDRSTLRMILVYFQAQGQDRGKFIIAASRDISKDISGGPGGGGPR